MNLIEYIASMLDDHQPLTKEDHAICRALINSMNDEDAEKMMLSAPLDWYTRNYLQSRSDGMENSPQPLRYKNWKFYYRNIQQRTKGAVVESRTRLQSLFPYLEWKTQLQVLELFISSSVKSEREWALKYINRDWSIIGDLRRNERNKWMACLTGVWEQCHDHECAMIILKNFPLSYIQEHSDELIRQCGYLQVDIRLAESDKYDINQGVLTDVQYLYVMVKAGRAASDDLCEAVLAESILSLLTLDEYPFERWDNGFSLLADSDVGLVVWCLGQLKKPDLIMRFYECDKILQRAMAYLAQQSSNQDDASMWPLMKTEIKNAFSISKYEPSHWERLIGVCPFVNTLLEILRSKKAI